MWLVQLILAFIVLGLILKAFNVSRAWLLIKEIELREPLVQVVSDQEIPEKYMPLFQFARQQLCSELPFGHRGTITIRSELPSSLVRYLDLFVSYDGRVLALVGANYSLCEQPFMVTYRSSLHSGTQLETVDGIGHLMFYNDTELLDAQVDDFREQFLLHLERIVELPKQDFLDFSELHLGSIAERAQQEASRQHQMMVEQGIIKATHQGVFRFSLGFRVNLVRQVMQGELELQKVRQKRYEQRAETANHKQLDVSPEADAAEFTYLQDRNAVIATRRTVVTKWVILLVSAIAFFFVFWMWLGMLISALLLLVVFIHEVGHASAMALFGYRNRQVLFIPFFGAAAIGEKRDAPPWQQLVVLFMGPLPGIAIGLACLFVVMSNPAPDAMDLRDRGVLAQIALLSLVLNYLNLLPLGFLDGGKIVQILFFNRFVRARFVFQFLSATAFLILSILLREVIIGVIAAVSFLALPSLWSFGTLIKQLQKRSQKASMLISESREAKRLEVFKLLREPPFNRWQPNQRHETAKHLIEYVEARATGLPTLIVGGAIYVASIIVPVLLVLFLIGIGDPADV